MMFEANSMAFKVHNVMRASQYMLRKLVSKRNAVLLSSSPMWNQNLNDQLKHPLPERSSSPREIKIPVPWGHIAAKEWGPCDGTPFLGLHGWLDNAGTFDHLAPLLPPHVRLLSLDLPGHGLSSYRPVGSTFTWIENVMELRRVVLHLGWNRFSILAHSMGSWLSLAYAGLFPEEIHKMIWLDCMNVPRLPVNEQLQVFKHYLQEETKLDSKRLNNPPSYTPEEIFNLLMSTLKWNDKIVSPEEAVNIGTDYTIKVADETVKTLIKRGVQPAKNSTGRLILNRDIRMRHSMFLLVISSADISAELAKRLKCELLILMSSDLRFANSRDVDDYFRKLYEASCPRFHYHKVKGFHHGHLDNPENFAPYICDFIS